MVHLRLIPHNGRWKSSLGVVTQPLLAANFILTSGGTTPNRLLVAEMVSTVSVVRSVPSQPRTATRRSCPVPLETLFRLGLTGSKAIFGHCRGFG